MATVELRKEQRLVSRGVSKGELYHPGSGQYLTVEKVRDISSKGVGLKVGSFLEQGEKVRLGFKRGRAHVHMDGYVAWCAPIETDDQELASFMLGITL